MAAPDSHAAFCAVYSGQFSDQHQANETMPCTCGYRARAAALTNERRNLLKMGVRPLGMSEHDFLLTLRIKPEL